MILGYTRTGSPVLRPTSSTDKAEFSSWTRGDHADASRILMEHGERETDPKIASRCMHWSSLHWSTAKKRSSSTTRTAAETTVRTRRR
jgi:hypothetical protein